MKRIALLSNITTDLLAMRLRKQYEVYLPSGYDTWIQEVINVESELNRDRFDAIFLILDGTEASEWKDIESGRDRIESWKTALKALIDHNTMTPIFVSTIDIRESSIKSLSEKYIKYELEYNWYEYIQGWAENRKNVYVMNILELITDIGRKAFYSNKMWYLSNCPYSKVGMDAICDEINYALETVFSERKKVLALDLDNTLWGGIAGEDGMEGIVLSEHKEGQRYYDFQRLILQMRERGVLLTIISKNNIGDVAPIIEKHSSMLIRSDAITAQRINWNDKAQNLIEIEAELNISENGFVFVDDNPVERENMKAKCSEVVVPDFPKETSDLNEFADKLWKTYFRTPRVVDEDLKRNSMYKAESLRKKDSIDSISIEDYLEKLCIELYIHEMRDNEVDRTVQLINKSNQFNLTTKRYSREEIERIKSDSDKKIFVAYCNDKYGESGLVCVLIVFETEREATIDTFLMSCRVMGRNVENVLMNEILNLYLHKEYVNSKFIATKKNEPVRDFYESVGFELLDSTAECKTYRKCMKDFVKGRYDNYKKIIVEE